MFFTFTLGDDQNNLEKSKKPITDILGLGKLGEAIANGLSKMLEKIPTNKLSQGQALFVIVLILSWVFYFVLLSSNSSRLDRFPFVIAACVLLTYNLIVVFIFIFLEAKKKSK